MKVGKPFLTYYDGDDRTELSYATFDNWVAKTANYLRDEHGVVPGTTVAVDLPEHWLTVVLAFAAWRCGATIVRGAGDASFTAGDLPDLREDVLVHPDAFTGGHDLPAATPDSRRRLLTGGVLDAALAAYLGGGSLVFGTFADAGHTAGVERAER